MICCTHRNNLGVSPQVFFQWSGACIIRLAWATNLTITHESYSIFLARGEVGGSSTYWARALSHHLCQRRPRSHAFQGGRGNQSMQSVSQAEFSPRPHKQASTATRTTTSGASELEVQTNVAGFQVSCHKISCKLLITYYLLISPLWSRRENLRAFHYLLLVLELNRGWQDVYLCEQLSH